MDERELLDVCRAEGGLWLGRTAEGALFTRGDGGWEPYEFNRRHAGYYPACRFTALARAGEMFYLAGTDGAGSPHVFSSLLGGVWEEKNLTARHPLQGEVRAVGAVVRILYDAGDRQVFLVCQGGQLVTLPDCPKCVRIQALRQACVADAALEGREIVVRFADGGTQRVALHQAAQYRVALSFLQKELRRGGVLVDVRPTEEYVRDSWPHSVNVPLEELDLWLQTQDQARALFFLCRTGALADVAARYARQCGFSCAYSVGGTHALAHVE